MTYDTTRPYATVNEMLEYAERMSTPSEAIRATPLTRTVLDLVSHIRGMQHVYAPTPNLDQRLIEERSTAHLHWEGMREEHTLGEWRATEAADPLNAIGRELPDDLPASGNHGMSTEPALHYYVDSPDPEMFADRKVGSDGKPYIGLTQGSRSAGKSFAQAVDALSRVTGFHPDVIQRMINDEHARGTMPADAVREAAQGMLGFANDRATATHAEEVPTASEVVDALAAALDAYPSDKAARDALAHVTSDRTAQRLIAAIRNAQKGASS